MPKTRIYPIFYHETIMALAALYRHADTENPEQARQFDAKVSSPCAL
jgi:hypothetical protein